MDLLWTLHYILFFPQRCTSWSEQEVSWCWWGSSDALGPWESRSVFWDRWVRARGLLGSWDLYPTWIDSNHFLPKSDVHKLIKKRKKPDPRQTRWQFFSNLTGPECKRVSDVCTCLHPSIVVEWGLFKPGDDTDQNKKHHARHRFKNMPVFHLIL